MKIAISTIEPTEAIQEIAAKTGGEIVGGATGVAANAEASASGDITFTKTGSDAYTFSYKTDKGTYSFSIGLAFGLGYSFEKA